jgi:hypothetical protein
LGRKEKNANLRPFRVSIDHDAQDLSVQVDDFNQLMNTYVTGDRQFTKLRTEFATA